MAEPRQLSPRGAVLRWTEATCALGGAVAAVLALDRRFGTMAAAMRELTGASERLQPYLGLVFVTAAAILGTVTGLGLLRGLDRAGKGRFAPPVVLLLVALLGVRHAPWLIWAAPLFVALGAPMLVTGKVRPVPRCSNERVLALVCIASEASCVGAGLWFPDAESLPAVLLPILFATAAIGVALAVRLGDETRWRVVFAGLPCLLLPFVGLERNPTLVPTGLALGLAAVALRAFVRWPRLAKRAQTWARRHATTFALPALLLVLVVPWHFRDLGTADLAGHEGQHYGWINSIAFGKLMMADAGFTYGPGREYTLAALAAAMGGLTIEHIRLAHVAVNVVGLLCIFAAIRAVCAGHVHSMLLALGLIVTHTALGSFVVYTRTYSFGWADACRAGLPTLAVVLALTRPLDGSRRARRILLGAGALTGFSVLYSHDFGVPAMLATWVGLSAEALVGRPNEPLRARARAALRGAAVYTGGVAVILVPFLLFYASRGKLLALLAGYKWTVQVSSGRVAFPGRAWVYGDAFDSLWAIRRDVDKDDTFVVARALDFVLAPGLAALGLAHVATALVQRRFAQRTTLVLALAVLVAAAMHHAFLAADAWHLANASTPALVLLFALGAGGRRLLVRGSSGRVLPLGVVAAALLPALWFLNGGGGPINMRLARIAAGEERPAKGEPYRYPDLPRVGDVDVGGQHLEPVRWIRDNSGPEDPVYCTTWMLGGGTEAFLSQRRNPTSFDKPDEVAGPLQREQIRHELKAEPPKLIVGKFFDYLDDETRRFIDKDWHLAATPAGVEIRAASSSR